MHNRVENICRLCLDVIDKDPEAIDDRTIDILKVLLDLDLTISKEPVMCKYCAKHVQKAFDFKSTCLFTEVLVLTFADAKHLTPFYMKDIYKENKNLITASDMVCRLCMECLEISNFTPLDTEGEDSVLLPETLSRCLPEINNEIVINPVICSPCLESLTSYYDFGVSCEAVEEKIKSYCQQRGTERDGLVKLSKVLKWSDQIDLKYSIKDEEICIKFDSSMDSTDMIGSNSESCPELDETKTCENQAQSSLFRCDICSYITKRKRFLKLHMQTHTDINTNEHRKSEHKTLQKRELERQQTVHKSNTGKQKHKTRKSKQILNKQRTYGCADCKYKTWRRKNFISHLLTHRVVSDEEMHKCGVCDYKTKRREHLKRHSNIHRDPSESKRHKCENCDYATNLGDLLTRHQIIHMSEGEAKMRNCDKCEYKTGSKSRLIAHRLVHKDVSEVTMYQCDICLFETKYKSCLKSHILTHKDVSQIKTYKCDICKAFQSTTKWNLNKHITLTHKDPSEVKIYRCDQCKYETTDRGRFTTHVKIHRDVSEVEMFTCEICKHQTRYKSALRKHLRRHRDISEVETFGCYKCGYKTRDKSNIRRHVLLHGPITGQGTFYCCKRCDFHVTQKRNLLRHQRFDHELKRSKKKSK